MDVANRIGAARIILVDDDEAFLAMVSALLTDEGYVVEAVADIRTALDSAAKAAPDLILLDLQMPHGDAEDFMAAYQAFPKPHAAVIVISGATDARARATAMGARSFVPKSFDITELLALVSLHT